MQPRTRANLIFTFVGLPLVFLIPSFLWAVAILWGYGGIHAYYRDDSKDRWGRDNFFRVHRR